MKDDSLYVGEFVDGRFQGQGTLINFEESGLDDFLYVAYQGQWYSNLKHGEGFKITYKNVTIIEEEEYEYVED